MTTKIEADEVERLCNRFQAGGHQEKREALDAVWKMADAGCFGACLVTGQALLGRGPMGHFLEPDQDRARPYLEKALQSPVIFD